MKKIIILIIAVFLILVLVVSGLKYNNNYGKKYFKDKSEIKAIGDLIQKQREVDKQITNYLNDNYTLTNAKVIPNPYFISPLTALIIFKTDNMESIEVKVNGEVVTIMEKSKEHLIPIYGLKADYDNIVELKSSTESSTYTIKTDEFKGNDLIVETTTEELDDSLYLLSPNFTSNRIYDKNGNLLWYLDGDYAGDIEYINNDLFYISDYNQGVNGVKINYPSFLTMDYLGKIYTQYVTDYGYHHEIVPLNDDKMLVLGYGDDSYYLDSVIYIMDLKTGKIIEEFDMYDILHNIDAEWTDNFGKNFDIVCNSAQYNEETKELLISTRGLNSIIKMDMETKEIKWIFGDPSLYSEKFEKYLLKYDGRYPKGQHTAFIKDGLLGLHNNDYDMFNIKASLGEYKDNYSSSDLYEVDEKNMTIKKVWTYDSDKKEFSKVAGALKILDNGNKLINYGWSINKDNEDNILINDEKYLNGVIVELDDDDNVLFKASTKDLIYRVYKVNLYLENTKNYNIISYSKISEMDTPEGIKTSSIVNKLEDAKKFEGDINVYVSRIGLTYDFDLTDEVNMYLVSKENKTYKYSYKASMEEPKNSINTSINEGTYALYVEINGQMYDTQKIINFDI